MFRAQARMPVRLSFGSWRRVNMVEGSHPARVED
jgi:hypothetical protein